MVLERAPEPPIAVPRGLAPWGPVDTLRLVGQGLALPLSTELDVVTVGTQACDVNLPATISQVGNRQATIVRVARANAICVRERDGVERVVKPGEIFELAGMSMLATDARLESIRRKLTWCMGLANHVAVDAALEIVADGHPIALLGAANLDALPLAQAIHAASPQRRGVFLAVEAAPVPSLSNLSNGTVFVNLDSVKATAPLIRCLSERARGLRVIFAARDRKRLRYRLDSAGDHVRAIELMPLAQRRHEVPALLAMHWRDDVRSAGRSVDELGDGVVGLERYAWPRNFDELREQSRRLLAVLEHGSLRPTARALGIRHQTLVGHFRRIGFWMDESFEDRRGSRDGLD